jgi:hypothetical protein
MIDHEFLTDFLRTYRYFSSALDVARLFIMIYVRSKEISHDKKNDGEVEVAQMETEDVSSHMKLRALNLFKKWITDQPQDFEGNELLCETITTFLNSHVSIDPKKVSYAESMIRQLTEIVLKKKEALEDVKSSFRVNSVSSSQDIDFDPEPRASVASKRISDDSSPKGLDLDSPIVAVKSGAMVGLRSVLYPQERCNETADSGTPSILELDHELLGQQLGLIEQKLFKEIPIHEFFCQGWTDKINRRSPSLQKLIAWFNSVATGMATEVVRQGDLKMRISVVKKLIIMAEGSLKYSNYNTCFEIVAGLNMAAISRLKLTWKGVPKKYLDTWEYLNQIVSNESTSNHP